MMVCFGKRRGIGKRKVGCGSGSASFEEFFGDTIDVSIQKRKPFCLRHVGPIEVIAQDATRSLGGAFLECSFFCATDMHGPHVSTRIS